MGLRINEILEEKGISIAELGRRINKSRSTMHATLEKGNPQYSTLIEIAEAIGVDVTELFEQPEKDGLIGIVRYNDVSYNINSISDIEKLLEEIKNVKK